MTRGISPVSPCNTQRPTRQGVVKAVFGRHAGPLPVGPGCDDGPMGAGFLKALLVIATAIVAAGCGGSPQPLPRISQPTARQQVTDPAALTRGQACQQLRADLIGNQGVPDIPTLRRIADHVTAPRMAADARTAVRDIDHTGIAPLALGLLRDECARAGVRIPAP